MSGVWNPTIEQGAVWRRTLTWRDAAGVLMNLTGYTARMALVHVNSNEKLRLTTENGRITLGGAAGTIVLEITAVDTATALVPTGRYVYDLEMVPGANENETVRLLQGVITVSPERTVTL